MAASSPSTAAALCLLLCACPTIGGAQSLADAFYGALRALADEVATVAADDGGGTTARPTAGEYVLLVGGTSVARYTPLDAGGSEHLLHDVDAVPEATSCAYFNSSVYCAGDYYSLKTWRIDRENGCELPPGPDLNRKVRSGSGRLASVNDEWLVTCGDWESVEPDTCQVLHINASHWVNVESQARSRSSAVAEHSGSVFVVGGWNQDGASAKVWSLQVSRAADGSDTFQWQRHPDMNTPRKELGIGSHNGWLYACGGSNSNEYGGALSDCERWREGMDSWQGIAPMPEKRRRPHVLSVDGHLIAMGGFIDLHIHYKLDVLDYNEAEDTWSRLHDMPDMEWFGSAVVPAL